MHAALRCAKSTGVVEALLAVEGDRAATVGSVHAALCCAQDAEVVEALLAVTGARAVTRKAVSKALMCAGSSAAAGALLAVEGKLAVTAARVAAALRKAARRDNVPVIEALLSVGGARAVTRLDVGMALVCAARSPEASARLLAVQGDREAPQKWLDRALLEAVNVGTAAVLEVLLTADRPATREGVKAALICASGRKQLETLLRVYTRAREQPMW